MPIISPKIPQGLEELMRGLAKSVIKENPNNIYEFAALYFENLLKERDGTVDHNYKKFATYKVYKKSKNARSKRGSENSNDVNEPHANNGFENNGAETYGSHEREKKDSLHGKSSLEQLILPAALVPLNALRQTPSLSSESEILTSDLNQALQESVTLKSGNSDEDDVNNMVLDEEMAQAALKIQSTFRGHKARKEVNDIKNEGEAKEPTELEVETKNISEAESDNILDVQQEVSSLDKGLAEEIEKLEDKCEGEPVQPVINEEIPSLPSLDTQNEEQENINEAGEDNMEVQEEEIIELQAEKCESQKSVDGSSGNMESFAKELENECEDANVVNAQSDEKIECDESNEAKALVNEGAENKENSTEAQEMSEKAGGSKERDNIEEAQLPENISNDEQCTEEVKLPLDENDKDEQSVVEAEQFVEEPQFKDDEPKIDDLAGHVAAGSNEQEPLNETNMDEAIDVEATVPVEMEEAFDDVKVEEVSNIESDLIQKPEVEEAEETKEETAEQEGEVQPSIEPQDVPEPLLENQLSVPITEEVDEINAEIGNGLEADETADSKKTQPEELEITKTFSTELAEVALNELPPQEEKAEGESFAEKSLGDEETILNRDEPQGTEPEAIMKEAANSEIHPEVNKTMQNESQTEVLPEILNDAEYDGVPVVEEVCVKKSVEQLGPDMEATDTETVQNDETDRAYTDEIQNETLEDFDKPPTCDIEYATLKESLSEHISVEETDAKAADLTDEKSIDPDTKGSSQNSVDDVNDIEVDVEPHTTQPLAEQELILNEERKTDEPILHAEISPIELMDEVVNAYAETAASEIFTDGIAANDDFMKLAEAENTQNQSSEHVELSTELFEPTTKQEELAEQATELVEPATEQANVVELATELTAELVELATEQVKLAELSTEVVEPAIEQVKLAELSTEIVEPAIEQVKLAELSTELVELAEEDIAPKSEHVTPALSEEKPLQSIETQKTIDLSQETVQVSQDVIEPITHEILNPEVEEEIPEENLAPMDGNVPTFDSAKSSTGDNESVLEERPTKMEEAKSQATTIEESDKGLREIDLNLLKYMPEEDQMIPQDENSQKKSDDEIEQIAQNIVIDQCSEEVQDNQDVQEVEQQDTSADVEDIQDSEAVEQEQTEQESQEDDNAEGEKTSVEGAENETTEQAEDDPTGTPEEGEASEQQEQANDDEDVANMVLDEEMEQAALKIQSTFRGHKTRKDIKKDESESCTADDSKPEKDDVENIDDDVANMVLDDEMEQAALKIQSTFRGHKTRKDIKNEGEGKSDEAKEGDEAEDEKEKEEPEEVKAEEPEQSSSTEKSAEQLQEEEDIANIVMDAEMEQTALKIQSAFRGKMNLRRKAPKDGEDVSASSTGDQTEEESATEDPFEKNEINQENESNSYENEKVSETNANYSSYDKAGYDRHDTTDYESEPLAPFSSTIEDINLMQGGGIFPEPSGESSDMLTTTTCSSGEDGDEPDRNLTNRIPSQHCESDSNSKEEQKSSVEGERIVQSIDSVKTSKLSAEASKSSAEAMYYSLKKNESEILNASKEKQLSVTVASIEEEKEALPGREQSIETADEEKDEDDDDVVIGVRSEPTKRFKYGMSMDDRLLGSILSKEYSAKSHRDGYPDDGFDPLLEATMNHHFLELHEMSNSDEDKNMYDDYPGDDEDKFDDFYNSNNVRQKMMASSISIADSDYFDHANGKSIIDDDKIRTALETIHSTSSESTIASGATKVTKIPVSERMMGKRNASNITSQSMQYSSIGNCAIDKSLDEFIQSQEVKIDRFEEEGDFHAGSMQSKQESGDWTDDTTTYTDSGLDKKVIGGIIDIKMEQKSFLTVDERRRTLHREDAIQRNSTREDEDSSKSSNASADKHTEEELLAVAVVPVMPVVPAGEISVSVPDLRVKQKSSSQTLPQVKPHRMKRQHTMPVQIQTDVIRVIPKHLRKRIKSADGEDKKRVSK